MALSIVYSKSLVAASANNIATSQALAAAGNLVLNGSTVVNGVATLDTGRQVIITSGGNDTGITFTVYGYEQVSNGTGSPIQETITGASGGAAATSLNFGVVTRIAASGAVATTVTAGTNGVGSTPWAVLNKAVTPHDTQIRVDVTGTINYTVEYTMDDLNRLPSAFPQPAPNPTIIPSVFPDGTLVTKTASGNAQLAYPVWAARTTINSGDGTIKMTVIQAGIAGP